MQLLHHIVMPPNGRHWFAYVNLAHGLRPRLHLLRRTFPMAGNAVHLGSVNDDPARIELNAVHEVGAFVLNPCKEGEFSEQGPAIVSGGGGEIAERVPAGELADFLQAIVDEAARWGIRATEPDAAPAKELAAVRYHLEDMRKLALDR